MVIAQHLPVIRHKHDERVIQQALIPHVLEQPVQLHVHVIHQPVVPGPAVMHRRRVQVQPPAPPLHVLRKLRIHPAPRPLKRRNPVANHRFRQVHPLIPVEKERRRRKRRMRVHERDIQEKRPRRIARFQEIDRPRQPSRTPASSPPADASDVRSTRWKAPHSPSPSDAAAPRPRSHVR